MIHPIRDRAPLMNFAHLMDDARIEEDTLGRGGFARVNMCNYADITRMLQGELTLRRVYTG